MSRIETLRAWLVDHPDDAFTIYALAMELRGVGAHVEAEALLRRHVALQPERGAAHFQLGRLLAETERTDAAREAWEAGLTVLARAGTPEAKRAAREIQAALDELDPL